MEDVHVKALKVFHGAVLIYVALAPRFENVGNMLIELGADSDRFSKCSLICLADCSDFFATAFRSASGLGSLRIGAAAESQRPR